jgi:chemotaxis protein MotB
MAKKAAQEHGGGGGHDGGGGLRWLLTYADMITLLMAFFIMLYSMSILNLNKFKEVAVSIRSGFGGKMEGGTSVFEHQDRPDSVPGDASPEGTKSVQDVAKDLASYIKEHALENSMSVSVEARGLIISVLSDNLLFPIGSAELRPGATDILDKISEVIRPISNPIMVEGHTCNLPIKTPQFPSNWELSAARACRVVRFLMEEYGIAPDRLGAVGYGDTRPVKPNDSEEHRRRNRRVDIVILTSGQ